MLVEAGIFDAYGSGREYAPAADVAANNDGHTYVQHRKWAALTPGRYTDDTQMTLANVRHLLSGEEHTAMNLARRFLEAFHQDERAGYAGGFYKLLQEVTTPEEFLRRIRPQSDRSGGAMRASPCGFLPTIQECLDLSAWQSSLTHATRDGMGAAMGAAAMVWACRHGCDRGYLPQFLEDTVPGFHWMTPWQGPVGAPGLESVKAALASVVAHDNLEDILKAAIAWTGDVDTVGIVAGSAASVHPNIENNLNMDLYTKLEPTGAFGLNFLSKLDDELEAAYPIVQAPSEEEDDVEAGVVENMGPPPSTDLVGATPEIECDHKLPDGNSALNDDFLFKTCSLCNATV